MSKPIVNEPYDPDTPRLDYDQVATAVHHLPDGALQVLLRGPKPGEGTCNACDVLGPLAEAGDEHAGLLMDWHNDLGTSERADNIVRKWVLNPAAFDFLYDESLALLGSISYGRCCAIYALARVEFMERGQPGYPKED